MPYAGELADAFTDTHCAKSLRVVQSETGAVLRENRGLQRPQPRLVGGIATVADQSDLDAAAVRPMLEVLADGLMT